MSSQETHAYILGEAVDFSPLFTKRKLFTKPLPASFEDYSGKSENTEVEVFLLPGTSWIVEEVH